MASFSSVVDSAIYRAVGDRQRWRKPAGLHYSSVLHHLRPHDAGGLMALS
jgi:hypothetical protein